MKIVEQNMYAKHGRAIIDERTLWFRDYNVGSTLLRSDRGSNRNTQTMKSSNVALFRMGDFLAFVLTHRVGFWTIAPGGAPGG